MKLVFLDAKTIGDDLDLSFFDQFGDVVKYSFSTPEEVPERVQDADVIIVNKIEINETTIGTAANQMCIRDRISPASFRANVPAEANIPVWMSLWDEPTI